MDKSNVTPFPGGKGAPAATAAPSLSLSSADHPQNLIPRHLNGARAIADLVAHCELDELYQDTLGVAMYAVMDHLKAVESALEQVGWTVQS